MINKKEAEQYLDRIEAGERLIFQPAERKLAMIVYSYACRISGGVTHRRKVNGTYEVVANWVLFGELHDKYSKDREVEKYVELCNNVYLRRGNKL